MQASKTHSLNRLYPAALGAAALGIALAITTLFAPTIALGDTNHSTANQYTETVPLVAHSQVVAQNDVVSPQPTSDATEPEQKLAEANSRGDLPIAASQYSEDVALSSDIGVKPAKNFLATTLVQTTRPTFYNNDVKLKTNTDNLEAISNTYTDEQGVIWSADKTVLILIPEGVSGVVRIGANVQSIEQSALSHCAADLTLELDADNPDFYVGDDGGLYSRETSELMWERAALLAETQEISTDTAVANDGLGAGGYPRYVIHDQRYRECWAGVNADGTSKNFYTIVDSSPIRWAHHGLVGIYLDSTVPVLKVYGYRGSTGVTETIHFRQCVRSYTPTQFHPTNGEGLVPLDRTYSVTSLRLVEYYVSSDSVATTTNVTTRGFGFNYNTTSGKAIDTVHVYLNNYKPTATWDAGSWTTTGRYQTTTAWTNDIFGMYAPNAPIRTGYSFTGWSTTAAKNLFVNKQTCKAGDYICVFEDTTFTANWKINTYNITWNLGGGAWSDGSTTSKTTTVNHGSTPVAPSDTPKRTGYTFTSWGTIVAATGATTYTAQWDKIKYNVTGVTNNTSYGQAPTLITLSGSTWSGCSTNSDSYYVDLYPYIHIEAHPNAGYKLSSWSYKKGGVAWTPTTTAVSGKPNALVITGYQSSPGDIEITANYVAISYSITKGSNSLCSSIGTPSRTSYSINSSSALTFTCTATASSGYKISGWSVSPSTVTVSGTTSATFTIPKNTYGDITVTPTTSKANSITTYTNNSTYGDAALAYGASTPGVSWIMPAYTTDTWGLSDTERRAIYLSAKAKAGYRFSSFSFKKNGTAFTPDNFSGTVTETAPSMSSSSNTQLCYVVKNTDSGGLTKAELFLPPGYFGNIEVTANYTSRWEVTGKTNNATYGSTPYVSAGNQTSYIIGTLTSDYYITNNYGYLHLRARPNTGYKFKSWTFTKGGSTWVPTYQNGSSTSSDATVTGYLAAPGDIVVTANYVPITYYVYYYSNDATNLYGSSSYSYGTTYSYPTDYTASLAVGQKHTGWSTTSEITANTTPRSGTFSNLTTTDGGKVYLYQRSELKNVTITWNPNGGAWSGSTAVKTSTFKYGENIVAVASPTRTACVTGGWATTTDWKAQTKEGLPPALGKATSDATYYAVWMPVYTMDHNGGKFAANGTEYPANGYAVNVGFDIAPYPNIPKQDGYVFVGRSWTQSSKTAEDLGKSSLATAGKAAYAIWHYQITWDYNGGVVGTSTSKTSTVYPGEAITAISDKPTKDGYEFIGWSRTKAASLPDDSLGKASAATTLYAVWRPACTFDTNGGIFKVKTTANGYWTDEKILDDVTTITVHLLWMEYRPKFTDSTFLFWSKSLGAAVHLTAVRVGYYPSGWEMKASDTWTSVTAESDGRITATPGATYRIKWTAKGYNLTMDDNGGSGGAGVYRVIYNQIYHFTRRAPSRPGYIFKGYYTQRIGGVQVYGPYQYLEYNKVWGTQCIRGTSYFNNDNKWCYDGDVTLYAQWEPNTYAINYISNITSSEDVVEEMPSHCANVRYAEDAVIAGNPKRYGYIFTGWNTSADGSGTSYPVVSGSDFVTLQNLTTENGVTVNLYAQWTLIERADVPINSSLTFDIPVPLYGWDTEGNLDISKNTIDVPYTTKITSLTAAPLKIISVATGSLFGGEDISALPDTDARIIWAGLKDSLNLRIGANNSTEVANLNIADDEIPSADNTRLVPSQFVVPKARGKWTEVDFTPIPGELELVYTLRIRGLNDSTASGISTRLLELFNGASEFELENVTNVIYTLELAQ